jgi:hypothetical protein
MQVNFLHSLESGLETDIQEVQPNMDTTDVFKVYQKVGIEPAPYVSIKALMEPEMMQRKEYSPESAALRSPPRAPRLGPSPDPIFDEPMSELELPEAWGFEETMSETELSEVPTASCCSQPLGDEAVSAPQPPKAPRLGPSPDPIFDESMPELQLPEALLPDDDFSLDDDFSHADDMEVLTALMDDRSIDEKVATEDIGDGPTDGYASPLLAFVCKGRLVRAGSDISTGCGEDLEV